MVDRKKLEMPASKVQTIVFPSFDEEEKAQSLIANAKKKAAAIERQAYEEGYAKGEAAGVQMGMAKVMPAVETFTIMIEELGQLIYQTLAAMEPEIIRLVIAIAERVIHTTIAGESPVVQNVIRAAIAEMDERWNVVVHVNPSEYEMLQKHPEYMARVERVGTITLLADPGVEPGGCRIVAPEGFVDATLKTALERVAHMGD